MMMQLPALPLFISYNAADAALSEAATTESALLNQLASNIIELPGLFPASVLHSIDHRIRIGIVGFGFDRKTILLQKLY